MIGKISGRVAYVAEDHALIEAGDVGYIVYCAPRTLQALPRPGGRAALYTELVVREDLMQLFGFTSLIEKEWHRLLTSVQGVGAKVSIAVLGALGPDAVSRSIALGDARAIQRAPGVGPKLAQRIVNELKDKAPTVMALGAAAAKLAPAVGAAEPADADDAVIDRAPDAAPEPAEAADAPLRAAGVTAAAEAEADALSALINLGTPANEAAAAVAEAAEASETAGETVDAAALIKAALRRLGSRLER